MEAKCQCGQLRVEFPGETPAVVACHCHACQRRTGAAFAVLACYPAEALTISGEATRFERTADSGNGFASFFCPNCGSTVYVRASARPEVIGLAVGTMADPAFKAPINSVWEDAKHHWVTIPGEIQQFPQARQQRANAPGLHDNFGGDHHPSQASPVPEASPRPEPRGLPRLLREPARAALPRVRGRAGALHAALSRTVAGDARA